MDEVTLVEDYQTGTTVLDSILNQTICDDLESDGERRQGFEGKSISAGMVIFSCQPV